MDKQLIGVSKFPAKHLRHSPHDLGLTLQPGGRVPMNDRLDAARWHGFPIASEPACTPPADRLRWRIQTSLPWGPAESDGGSRSEGGDLGGTGRYPCQ